MGTGPDGTGTSPAPAGAEPREAGVARALVSSPLPLPTTTRLVLLVMVAGAGAAFATWWWLVLGRDNWPHAQLACLPAAGAAPDAVLARFTGCVDDVRLAQSAVVLCGPLALSALAVLCRAAGRRLGLWRWRAAPDHTSPLAGRLAALVADEPGPRPVLWVRGRRVGVRARASGTVRRPLIVADSHVFALPARQTDAMLRHELGHIRLRDVGRVRLAASAWWLLLLAVTAPMAVALVRDPGLLGAGLLVRMAVVLAVVLLTLCAVLRVREHDADLAAVADPRAPEGETAAYLGAALPPRRAERVVRSLGLATHPTPAARLAVLGDPARSWGLSSAECLTTGLAAGLVFTDLALLVSAALPGHTQLAYSVAGLLTGWAVAGVVTVAWWRAVAVGHRDASAVRVAPAGAALGLGVLLGSQLTGRAAGDWVRDTGTVDGLATALSLTEVPPGQVLLLGLVLVVGGALFGLWSTALARSLGAAPSGPRSAPACAAAAGLSGLLLAVPLGSWFLCARLTAAGAAPDIRRAVVGTPWWVAGTVTAVAGAVVPVAAARARTWWSASPGPRRPRPLSPLIAAVVLVAAGAGRASFGGSPGGTPAEAPLTAPAASPAPAPSADADADTIVPPSQLPLFPSDPAQRNVMRKDTALVCRALSLGGTAQWTDPRRRSETAELLAGPDDLVLRAASDVLTGRPSGPVDTRALVASVLRCDLYFRYGR